MGQERLHASPGHRRRVELRADCERCFALCCVAHAFAASADFAIDKAAGQPCPKLGADFRCSIHAGLRQAGFGGCAAYDCFGAGQQVAQVTYGGRDWRRAPEIAAAMFASFAVLRQLHELLWYLNEALILRPTAPLLGEIGVAFDETERLTYSRPEALADLDVAAHRQDVNALLVRASEQVRRQAGQLGTDLRGADLIGTDLRRADLRRASLRGARLIGADLSRADLTMADCTGADFRGASVVGADLGSAIFLTQSQLDSARGNAATKLPSSLSRPSHWPSGRP